MVEKLKACRENFSKSPKAKTTMFLALYLLMGTIIFTNARKTITLTIDDATETVVVYSRTVEDVLTSKGIEVEEKDKVQPALESKVNENEEIIVKNAVPIEFAMGNKKTTVYSAEETIGQVLTENMDELKSKGIDYDKDLDEINPGLNTKAIADLAIKIVDVEIKTVKEDKSIPYETVVKRDSNLEKGKKVVKNEGTNGKKQVKYKITYKDGKEVSKKEVQSKTLSKPVNALVVEGTKNPIKYIPNRGGSAPSGNAPTGYKKKIVVESTAYALHGITATGTKPVYNPGGISTIAVDPRVIPLGSLVYVEGYGLARAADTGGAIKGNIIDVYFNSNAECTQWGRKHGLNAYIISYPGE
ncbi:G5 domain-containing protein [uncultured Clostridium sp.]|uniref:3D domain-containing protein n=1 Tax=uncultured Clostridium sp. TaxID=59620 RepID=UPI00262181A3|nr:G5 domain-containing protein [uncultured Clostridium sp.]